MFGNKKKPAAQTAAPGMTAHEAEAPFNAALDWEASRQWHIEKSERRAWRVAGVFGGGFLLAMIAIVVMMPLKRVDSYVIRDGGNNGTGAPQVLTRLDSENVTYSETTDKYWLSQYVLMRETYDWYTLQKSYDTVGLWSSRDVGQAYAALFEGDNAIDKVNGNTYRITVKILSVVPNGRGIGTVRFQTIKKRTDDPVSPGTPREWIATIGYEYRNPSVLTEAQRLVNPYGFQVRSYRVDAEMVGGGK
jgi:type IV secretion system protein VirB8